MHNKKMNRTRFSALNFSRLTTCFMLFFLLCTFSLAWSQQTICYGSVKKYTVDTAENSGIGTLGSTYDWTVTGGSFLGTISPTITSSTNAATINWGLTPPGNYTVSVKEVNINGCFNIQNLQVTINRLPVVNLNDLIVCTNPITGTWLTQGILNTRLSPSLYGFVWQLGGITLPETTPSINAIQVGVYNVTVTNIATGCQATDTANIRVSSAPKATVTVTNPFDDVQNIVVTLLNGIGDYEYSIDGSNYQNTGIFVVDQPGNYNIIVRDKFYCGQVSLPVFACGYPKFFTPNGDSFNDFWNIIALPNPTKTSTTIYDRYGKLIHQINSINPGWDGTFNGVLLPANDYWFTVEYFDTLNNFQTFKSHFSLLR